MKLLLIPKKVGDAVKAQLVQGVSPEALARTFAIGGTIALIPVLGVATFLCFLVGMRLKLNQPLLQGLNYLLYPVQLILIPVFLSYGAVVFHDAPLNFNLALLMSEFKESPGLFFAHYGIAGFHAFLLWLFIAPGVAALIYCLSLRILRAVLRRARLSNRS